MRPHLSMLHHAMTDRTRPDRATTYCCVALRYIPLHCILLHFTMLHYIALHDIASNIAFTSKYIIYNTVHHIRIYSALHFKQSLHFIAFHHITFHHTTLHCIDMHVVDLLAHLFVCLSTDLSRAFFQLPTFFCLYPSSVSYLISLLPIPSHPIPPHQLATPGRVWDLLWITWCLPKCQRSWWI